jgi:hypothetical protein
LGSASLIVIVPRQPVRALAGQLTRITASPRAVALTVRVEIATGVATGGGVPDVGAAFAGGLGDGTCSVRIVWALSPPLRLIVWPVKTWVVEVPAESVSVSVAV